MEHPLEATIAG